MVCGLLATLVPDETAPLKSAFFFLGRPGHRRSPGLAGQCFYRVVNASRMANPAVTLRTVREVGPDSLPQDTQNTTAEVFSAIHDRVHLPFGVWTAGGAVPSDKLSYAGFRIGLVQQSLLQHGRDDRAGVPWTCERGPIPVVIRDMVKSDPAYMYVLNVIRRGRPGDNLRFSCVYISSRMVYCAAVDESRSPLGSDPAVSEFDFVRYDPVMVFALSPAGL